MNGPQKQCMLISPYSSVSNKRGEVIEGSVHVSQFSIDGGGEVIERVLCRLVFNKKRVLIEGGMHVGGFSIEKECSVKVIHAGNLFH